MGAADAHASLQASGFRLAVVDGALVVGPASELTEADRDLIRKHRDELVRRLLDPDPRVTCSRCSNLRLGQCVRHRQAGLMAPDIGPDLAAMPQHCPAFVPLSVDTDPAVLSTQIDHQHAQ